MPLYFISRPILRRTNALALGEDAVQVEAILVASFLRDPVEIQIGFEQQFAGFLKTQTRQELDRRHAVVFFESTRQLHGAESERVGELLKAKRLYLIIICMLKSDRFR